jgi:hypothetical protein
MSARRKAKDFFSLEPVHGPSTTKDTILGEAIPTDNSAGRRHSARLESRSSAKTTNRNSLLEERQSAKRSSRVSSVTPVSGRMRTRKSSAESHSTDDVFVDAKDMLSPVTPSIYPNFSVVVDKTPGTARTAYSYVSAVDSINGKKRKISKVEGEALTEAEDVLSDGSTPGPSTQNTLVNIPSSQPRPRSHRSPLPLQPVPSSPAVSLPPSTAASDVKSTFDSITVLRPPKADESEDSDDEAPEAISLSKSRSQALQSQSQIAQQTKAQAEKAREKRRQRDRLLATQKQEKQEKLLKSQIEITNSQQSVAEVNSGNTTDTPAPNQDHQAARIARHAEVISAPVPTALPTSILQAASATWLQPDSTTIATPTSHPTKKRKERDDGVRILEEMNIRLAPKAGKIGMSKEEMIMRMGRGERKMYIGRFAR